MGVRLVVLLALACAAGAATVDSLPPIRPLRADLRYESTPRRLARGRELAEGLLQCFVCHSERDETRPGAPPRAGLKGAGRVWPGKEGLVAPNITPDRATGAGTWPDDAFARAIREGVGHDGRVLDRQMWYASFRYLTDEDLASVVVYLRTIPPVRRALPKTRRAPKGSPPEPVTPLDTFHAFAASRDPVERGAYAAVVADCAGCHTGWYGPTHPGLFAGGNAIREAVWSTNITPDPSGIPYYDERLFMDVMRTGRVVARELHHEMPWIAFRHLEDGTLRDLFAFLQALPPMRHTVQNGEPPTKCAACGLVHGGGDRNRPKDAGAGPVPPALVAAAPGQYRFDFGLVITVERRGDGLYAGEPGRMDPLFAVGPGLYSTVAMPDTLRFETDAAGRVTALVIAQFRERGKRVR